MAKQLSHKHQHALVAELGNLIAACDNLVDWDDSNTMTFAHALLSARAILAQLTWVEVSTQRQTVEDKLNEASIDPLLPSATVCAAKGGIARETLSRWVAAGRFPKPDKIVNKRNYWFASTVRNADMGEKYERRSPFEQR
jgi:predicted DNA-binding transcriptional regulator AlpA